jgi:PTH2 family peptidyl-tRNA hydrolase
MIRANANKVCAPGNEIICYRTDFTINKDLYEQWISGSFTKVVLQAKNSNNLMKAAQMAKELGMVEGIDYFIIRDNCNTELTPDETGSCLTCIGFRPMDSEVIDQIGKKYNLYKE